MDKIMKKVNLKKKQIHFKIIVEFRLNMKILRRKQLYVKCCIQKKKITQLLNIIQIILMIL